MAHCVGDHEIYVAEVVGVEAEGTVTVITVCRRCDSVNFHTKKLAENKVPLRMLKEEANSKK
jgi:hypothetical protein